MTMIVTIINLLAELMGDTTALVEFGDRFRALGYQETLETLEGTIERANAYLKESRVELDITSKEAMRMRVLLMGQVMLAEAVVAAVEQRRG